MPPLNALDPIPSGQYIVILETFHNSVYFLSIEDTEQDAVTFARAHAAKTTRPLSQYTTAFTWHVYDALNPPELTLVFLHRRTVSSYSQT